MDIEQLNKTQLILLTLLVSFVTSTATGIVTASIMQEAPPAITQTVNRVVERTVEKVVPGQAATVAVPVTKTETIVVKESEAIARGVARISPSVIRVYTASADAPTFLSLGAVISSNGSIALDESAIGERPEAIVEVGSGVRVRAFVTSRDSVSGVAFLSVATSTIDGKPVPAWKPIALSSQRPVLGQTIVSLSGKTALRLGQGILASTESLGEGGAQLLETDIAASLVMTGGLLIDTDGGVLGMSTGVSRAAGEGVFVSADVLKVK